MCLPGTSICARWSNVFALWLLFPAGSPSYTLGKNTEYSPAGPCEGNLTMYTCMAWSFPCHFFPTVLNMHPALSLIGISEPEKTSYKSPWGFDGEGNEPKATAQAETGNKALGPLRLPLGGVYSGTNKEEKAVAWLSRARRSTFTELSHSPN